MSRWTHPGHRIEPESQARRFRPARFGMVVVLWLVPSLLLLSAFTFGWTRTWSTLGIPSLTPYFVDLRIITGGVLTVHNGGDPLVSNPFDPMGRTLNYPRIWLSIFSLLGINDRNIGLVGIVMAALFLVSVSDLIVKSRREQDAVIILLAALSLAPLFAIERGNIDLLIFSLVYGGCVIKPKRLKPLWFAVATILKIYPVAGMIVEFFRRPLKERAFPLVLILVVLGIFSWQWRDLNLIRQNTPISSSSSFGILSIKAQALYYAAHFGLSTRLLDFFGYVVVASCWLTAAFFVIAAWRGTDQLPEMGGNAEGPSELFTVFGSLYVFCFLVGSNWNYRLILLIPTLPFAFHLMREPKYRRWSIFYVFSAICSENWFAQWIRHGMSLGLLASFASFLFVVAILTQQIKILVYADGGVLKVHQ